jgi:hypothetical protein
MKLGKTFVALAAVTAALALTSLYDSASAQTSSRFTGARNGDPILKLRTPGRGIASGLRSTMSNDRSVSRPGRITEPGGPIRRTEPSHDPVPLPPTSGRRR